MQDNYRRARDLLRDLRRKGWIIQLAPDGGLQVWPSVAVPGARQELHDCRPYLMEVLRAELPPETCGDCGGSSFFLDVETGWECLGCSPLPDPVPRSFISYRPARKR